LAFGAYAGAIAWATAGAGCVGLYGFGLAVIVMQSPVELAIGGAFFGCLLGGMLGAVVGLLVAFCVWSASAHPRRQSLMAILTVFIGCNLLMGLNFVFHERIWGGPIFVASFVELQRIPWLLLAYLGVLSLAGGTSTGLWLWMRIERFVYPPSSGSP
jgi:hypothetical protein